MIEKIKPISNPLTIIAIFAALAEVAGTVALSTVAKDLQNIFIWFVMLFPIFLVGVFFLTLNLNPRVLYSPSDYRDEENFVRAMKNSNMVSRELSAVLTQIESIKEEVVKIDRQGAFPVEERKSLSDVIKAELEKVGSRVSKVENIVNDPTDVRNWPHKKPCPKCGGEMWLNHDAAEYACEKCEYWE